MTLFNDVMVVWEMRGSYPDIKHFQDVDIAELTHGDDDPMFLTLPIGKVDSTSGNGRFYDEAWLTELERQVTEKRPTGIMGHLKPEDVGTAFPPEAIHWVGVQRIGEMLWGKGYIPLGEARDRVRRFKATKRQMATSIFAEAKGVWDATLNAFRMVADSMKLMQIDIGPPERVGIPGLAALPIVTAEMQGNEDTTMDKVQVIREMTVEDADLLPKAVKDAIAATLPTPGEVGLVAELRTTLGLDEKADLTAVITELQNAKKEQGQKDIDGRITELVTDTEKGIKIKELQPLVTELVSSRSPKSVADVDAVYQQVVEMEQVKSAMAAYVKTNGGAPLGKVVGGNGAQPINKWFTREEVQNG